LRVESVEFRVVGSLEFEVESLELVVMASIALEKSIKILTSIIKTLKGK
jgi:hypothetical protein